MKLRPILLAAAMLGTPLAARAQFVTEQQFEAMSPNQQQAAKATWGKYAKEALAKYYEALDASTNPLPSGHGQPCGTFLRQWPTGR
jgi:cytochrome P450